MKPKKKLIQIALSGSSGRMGQSLKKLIKKSSALQLAAFANQSFLPENWEAGKISAVIDFSLPDLFSQSLKWAAENKKPFVSGTTGLSPRQKKALKEAGKKIPVFYGENMSAGVFLLSLWLQGLFYEKTQILIEDIHHKDKKDKPSGTALRLKSSLPSFLNKRAKIKSKRKGRELGTHRVFLKTPGEQIVLEHKALDRSLFAAGALQALFFIIKKKKGLYGPSDLYSGKKLKLLP